MNAIRSLQNEMTGVKCQSEESMYIQLGQMKLTGSFLALSPTLSILQRAHLLSLIGIHA